MGLTSLIAVVTVAVSLVNGAPLSQEKRQVPSGVPDYVLKYGELFLSFSQREKSLLISYSSNRLSSLRGELLPNRPSVIPHPYYPSRKLQ